MALDSVRLNQLKLTRGHLAGTLRASPQAVEIQAAGARPDESLHLQVDPVTWRVVFYWCERSKLHRGRLCRRFAWARPDKLPHLQVKLDQRG